MLGTTQAAYSNATNNMTFTLDSFNNINMTYTLESSPLDNLIVNSQIVPTTKCNASFFPNLNCLQTSSNILLLSRCQRAYQMSMSMSFNDPTGVLSTLVTTRTFVVNMNFLCILNL